MLSIKNKLMKISSLLLAATMLITSTPNQVFAEESNTAGNTGGGSTGKLTVGTDYMGWYVQLISNY